MFDERNRVRKFSVSEIKLHIPAKNIRENMGRIFSSINFQASTIKTLLDLSINVHLLIMPFLKARAVNTSNFVPDFHLKLTVSEDNHKISAAVRMITSHLAVKRVCLAPFIHLCNAR